MHPILRRALYPLAYPGLLYFSYYPHRQAGKRRSSAILHALHHHHVVRPRMRAKEKQENNK